MEYHRVKVCSSSLRTPLMSSSVQALHSSLPAFAPAVPVSFLPLLALILLSSTFALAFYFTT